MLISLLPWQYTSAEESNVIYQCQSKQKVSQYSDASQNDIFHNINSKLSELTTLFLLIPNV